MPAFGPRIGLGARATGVGFSLDAFMASQAARLYLDTTRLNTTWQDAAATTPCDTIGQVMGAVEDAITATSSPNNATQSTGSLKPVKQSTGAKFDGTDDWWLSTYLASATMNFIVALVTVPSSLSAGVVIAGTNDAGGNGRLSLVFDANGHVQSGVGSVASNLQTGTTDFRNATTVIGVSCNGSIVRVFGGAAVEYQGAQSGAPNTTVPLGIGAQNVAGSPTAPFPGSIKKLVAGRQFLDLATYLQIRTALLAS